MLVCHVSLRAPRRAIGAALAETATAVDASTTGNIIFAALVDDPASVRDTVDAYLGEIMVEAANAADAFNVGLAYAAALDEAVTAGDIQSGMVGAPGRSAMVAGPSAVFVNPSMSRAANVNGTMVNL